jgi:hypothetical protein
MTKIDVKLHRLRWLFAAYFVAMIGIDVFFSLNILTGQSLGLGRVGLTPGALLAVALLAYAAIFAATWWLFHQLLLKKRWARTMLLVGGWLAVLDAVSSFLLTREAAGLGQLLGQLTPELDWERLAMLDRIKDIFGLLYWGYAIYVLQIDPEVKREFFPK